MEGENGSASIVTFYISKNSFVNQCYEEEEGKKQYFASKQCDFSFIFIAMLWILIYFKQEKIVQAWSPVTLNSLAVFTDGPLKSLL